MKRIRTDIFNIDIESKAPYQGSLLVAEPFLQESYFNHAVVTLVSYDRKDGALGLVMNNITDFKMPDLLPQIDRTEETEKIEVFLGGPVADDRLFYIHTLGPEVISDAAPVGGGLYVGGKFEDVVNYVNSGYPTDGRIRFFVGYSGWVPGQLEEEIGNNVWAVTDLPQDPSDMLSGADDPYWHRIVKNMGLKYRSWLYHPRDIHSN